MRPCITQPGMDGEGREFLLKAQIMSFSALKVNLRIGVYFFIFESKSSDWQPLTARDGMGGFPWSPPIYLCFCE